MEDLGGQESGVAVEGNDHVDGGQCLNEGSHRESFKAYINAILT